MASLGKTWQFPTISESFADADAAASSCITTVNWERWTQSQQTGAEYNPLTPPTVSMIPFPGLICRLTLIAGNQRGRPGHLVQSCD